MPRILAHQRARAVAAGDVACLAVLLLPISSAGIRRRRDCARQMKRTSSVRRPTVTRSRQNCGTLEPGVCPPANGCQFHAVLVEWRRSAAAPVGSNQEKLGGKAMTEKTIRSRSVLRRTMLVGTAGVLGGAVLRPTPVRSQTGAAPAVAVPGSSPPGARYGDPAWWAQRKEEILEPALEIVDPHHHLWDRGGHRYLLDQLLADTGSGHNITQASLSNAVRCIAPTGRRR